MDFMKSPLDGISVIIGEEDVTNISATIEGPSELQLHVVCYWKPALAIKMTVVVLSLEDTPFEGGAFKMKLVLGHDFPASPPQGTMLVV